MMSSMYTTECI